jgi:putative ABC transport system permease protein
MGWPRRRRRDVDVLRWLSDLGQDLRYVLRTLRTAPGFAAVAILTLALGIGASTVVFSVAYTLLFDALPYRSSDRIVTFAIHNLTNSGGSAGRNWYSQSELVAFHDQNHVFEDIVGFRTYGDVVYSAGQHTRQLPAEAAVTPNTFEFYGVPPLLGRGITADDGRADAPPVFVMDYRLWQKEFGGDPAILGKTFVLNGEATTLVGIMPPRFRLYGVGLWVQASVNDGGVFTIMGRLKRGVSLRTAAVDLDVIAHNLTGHEPGNVMNPERYTILVQTFTDVALGEFKTTLYALVGAVLMLLLIACANVANLLLARAAVREREVAIRAALGASRGRLVRQFLAESFVLSAAACVGGCFLAYFGLAAMPALIPPGSVPAEAMIGVSPRFLLFALSMALLTTLMCGVAPARHAVGGELQPRLTTSAKGALHDVRHGRFRTFLVVAEVALSIVLLVGAGLMWRTVFALTRAVLPFNPDNLLYVRLTLPRDRYYGKPDRKPAFFRQVLPRIEALPGVISATETLMLPPDEGSWTDIAIPGKPHRERWDTDIEMCTAGYFSTLGLRVLRGRPFTEDDVEAARHVVVVNETLARRYFGNDDPVGQKIKFEVFDRSFVDAPHHAYFDIIGVVSDFQSRPDATRYMLKPDAFVPASIGGFGRPLHIVARTSVDPHTLLNSVYREIWAVDPAVAFSASGSIADVLHDEFAQPRFELITLGAFAGVGLVLVIVGVASVMAYTVSLRTHEIGVRMALGARQSDIARMVLAQGFGFIAAGAAAGVSASLALTRVLASQTWGVSPTDPRTFGAVIAVILVAGAGACSLPARRAAQVDPSVALRGE